MNKIVLFAGAISMVTMGYISKDESLTSGGLVLMWLGLAQV